MLVGLQHLQGFFRQLRDLCCQRADENFVLVSVYSVPLGSDPGGTTHKIFNELAPALKLKATGHLSMKHLQKIVE